MIAVKCSHCGKQYQLRDELAGKQAKCQCGQVMVVPQARPAPGSAPPTGASAVSGGSPLDDALGADLASASAPATLPRLAKPAKQAGPNRLVIAAIVGGGVLALVLVGLVVFSLVGTGDGPGETTAETTAAEAAPPGFATPEEAFEAHKKATLAKHWLAQIRGCTPESQERLATGIGVAAMMSYKSEPKLMEILERHGVDASILGEEALGAKPENTAQLAAWAQKLQQQLAAAVKDKQAFYVEMQTGIQKVQEERQKDASAQMRAEAAQLQADAEKAHTEAKLVDLQIDGDSAQAKQSMTLQGNTIHRPIHFRRIDGRWYMHVPDPLSPSQ